MALNKIDKNMIQDLPEELNSLTEQLAQTVKKVNNNVPDENGNITIDVPEVDTTNLATKTELQAIASGSPKGVYATLSALQTAFPTGNNSIYVVSGDGKWYFWNGSSWAAGGIYQSTGISNKSVTRAKLGDDTFPLIRSIQNNDVALQSSDLEPYNVLAEINISNALVLSNQMHDYDPVFFPPYVSEISFKMNMGQFYVILGGTPSSYVGVRFALATEIYPNTGQMAQFNADGTYIISTNASQQNLQWTTNDKVTIKAIDGGYEIYKNDVLKMTLLKSVITDITAWNDNSRLGIVVKKSLITTSGVLTELKEHYIGELIKRISSIETVKSKWNAKKWNVLGDSITDLTHSAATQKYHQVIAEQKGIMVNAYGMSSTEISSGGTFVQPFIERYLTMDKTADLITVFGGVNDFLHNVPMGTFTSRNNETFYGALHNLMIGLYTNFPNARFGFFTPMQSFGTYNSDNQNTLGLVLKDYRNAIIEVAQYYGIPVLDLYSENGLAPRITNIRTQYVPDGLHPNNAGHEILASKIGTFIETL